MIPSWVASAARPEGCRTHRSAVTFLSERPAPAAAATPVWPVEPVDEPQPPTAAVDDPAEPGRVDATTEPDADDERFPPQRQRRGAHTTPAQAGDRGPVPGRPPAAAQRGRAAQPRPGPADRTPLPGQGHRRRGPRTGGPAGADQGRTAVRAGPRARVAAYATPSIAGDIKKHFRDHGWGVRPPRAVQELVLSVRSTASDLSQTLHHSRRSPSSPRSCRSRATTWRRP